MIDHSAITALLCPTNTGKTHRAVERMLEHPSGMMGLPLRLLAREIYDRLTARIGEARVALVTGEEKRVPRRPDYWVCTVEAMPQDLDVDFVAVDEVQLAADAQRGHVFTARLLGARGRRETWLLGAATMRPIVAELVPTARIVEHPRLSRLSWVGADKPSRLPPRSAVVAFSAEQVYELADKLRVLRGGTAVVLGALSPRTRNAQVAMFQAGEVDHLVATDAIGMGLNLDVDHVAFAALRKFDGRQLRELDAAEVGQIAGRAGRYLRDGTFGTLSPVEMPAAVASAVEGHRFAPVQRLYWRNPHIDTSSLAALVASLRRPSPSRRLRVVDDAEDGALLDRLLGSDAVRARAQSAERVALLWEVCRVPDFRKLLLESHAELLGEVFLQLSGPREVLDVDWVASRVGAIDQIEGDLEDLLARIAAIRTWTYIAHQPRWVADAAAWQERTRAIEDRLSDALHARLVLRFVDRRGKRRPARSAARGSAPAAGQGSGSGLAAGLRAGSASDSWAGRDSSPGHELAAPDPSHPFAALARLRAPGATGAPMRPPIDAWVDALVEGPHDRLELAVDAQGLVELRLEERPVARLGRGVSVVRPDVRLFGLDGVGQGARLRIQRRALAYVRDLVGEVVGPLHALCDESASAALKGVAYQLEHGLGTADTSGATAQLEALRPEEPGRLARAGVVWGERCIYLRSALAREAWRSRVALAAAFHRAAALPALAGRQAPARPASFPVRPGRGVRGQRLDDEERPEADEFVRALAALGYLLAGRRAVRVDVAERVIAAFRSAPVEAPPPRERLARWLGCPPREVPHLVSALLS